MRTAPQREVLFWESQGATSDGSPGQRRPIQASHLNVAPHIKDSKDIRIMWGFPVIWVCVVLQDPGLSSPFAGSTDRIMEG